MFDTSAQLVFRTKLAEMLRFVDPSEIRIVSVIAGSVVVNTEIQVPTSSAAHSAAVYLYSTPAAVLSSNLGVTITAVSVPIVHTRSYNAPSPPPPSLPPVPAVLSKSATSNVGAVTAVVSQTDALSAGGNEADARSMMLRQPIPLLVSFGLAYTLPLLIVGFLYLRIRHHDRNFTSVGSSCNGQVRPLRSTARRAYFEVRRRRRPPSGLAIIPDAPNLGERRPCPPGQTEAKPLSPTLQEISVRCARDADDREVWLKPSEESTSSGTISPPSEGQNSNKDGSYPSGSLHQACHDASAEQPSPSWSGMTSTSKGTKAVSTASIRSEAVLARAAARAKAKAVLEPSSINVEATVPRLSKDSATASRTAMPSQQRWLAAAMDAVSAQEEVAGQPVNVQLDWLSLTISRIVSGEDDGEDSFLRTRALRT